MRNDPEFLEDLNRAVTRRIIWWELRDNWYWFAFAGVVAWLASK